MRLQNSLPHLEQVRYSKFFDSLRIPFQKFSLKYHCIRVQVVKRTKESQFAKIRYQMPPSPLEGECTMINRTQYCFFGYLLFEQTMSFYTVVVDFSKMKLWQQHVTALLCSSIAQKDFREKLPTTKARPILIRYMFRHKLAFP